MLGGQLTTPTPGTYCARLIACLYQMFENWAAGYTALIQTDRPASHTNRTCALPVIGPSVCDGPE